MRAKLKTKPKKQHETRVHSKWYLNRCSRHPLALIHIYTFKIEIHTTARTYTHTPNHPSLDSNPINWIKLFPHKNVKLPPFWVEGSTAFCSATIWFPFWLLKISFFYDYIETETYLYEKKKYNLHSRMRHRSFVEHVLLCIRLRRS